MLILTRRIGETLCIGDDIKITIRQISGQQVKLSVEAPKDIVVHRSEIYERIQQDKLSEH